MQTQPPTLRCFTMQDAPPQALQDERIVILGYGHLGQPFALNLRDSGYTALVGNIADDYAERARQEGFRVLPIAEAVAQADVLLALLSDEVLADIYATQIAPYLASSAAIVFASGYNLAYGLITAPANVDVLMLAPRMAGENARQQFLQGKGFYAFVSVEQDASGKAWKRLLGLAEATGILKAGALELSALQEANLDLLIEQTLGAALGVAIMNAFSLGVEAGLPPESLVMEMYMSGEMEAVWRSFHQEGFFRASSVHGPTALFGGFLRTMQFAGSDLPKIFAKIFEEITSGQFARHFQAEREAGYPLLSQAQAMSSPEALANHPIAQAESRLRQLLDHPKV